MPSTKAKDFRVKINKLHRIEERARKLRAQLDRCEEAWDATKLAIDGKAGGWVAWNHHCEENGFSPDYTFRDALA